MSPLETSWVACLLAIGPPPADSVMGLYVRKRQSWAASCEYRSACRRWYMDSVRASDMYRVLQTDELWRDWMQGYLDWIKEQ